MPAPRLCQQASKPACHHPATTDWMKPGKAAERCDCDLSLCPCRLGIQAMNFDDPTVVVVVMMGGEEEGDVDTI